MPGFATDQIVADIWRIKVLAWIHYTQNNPTPVMSHLLFNHLPNSTPFITQLVFNHLPDTKLTNILRV